MVKKERVYTLECNECGHVLRDNILWGDCLVKGCSGKYIVIDEMPAGV